MDFIAIQERVNEAGETIGAQSVAGGTLLPNYLYQCQVRAVNTANLYSEIAESDGFTFDSTPPSGGYVVDGYIDTSDSESPQFVSRAAPSEFDAVRLGRSVLGRALQVPLQHEAAF